MRQSKVNSRHFLSEEIPVINMHVSSYLFTLEIHHQEYDVLLRIN